MTYDVTVELDGRFWLITVPAIDKVTQARNLAEIDLMAKELITIVTGEENPAINVQLQLPDTLTVRIETVEKHRQDEAAARKAAADELRAAARELRARGLTLSDVGKMLGVSHQRASQLTRSEPVPDVVGAQS